MSKSKKSTKTKTILYPLESNDLIEIIAPGSSAPIENLIKGADVLRQWGFKVQYDENILKPDMYLANSDHFRFQAFKKAVLNPDVKAIWCLRGGYGAIRLLPAIEKMAIPKNPKLLIGFSDVTSLHNVINRKWNWPSLHASLIDRLAGGRLTAENIRELKSSLFERTHHLVFENLTPLNAAAERKKMIEAKAVGGNLVVLTSSIGTPSQIKTKGKILFLEETGERGYRVDRSLQQLKQAGILSDVAAVVFGDMTHSLEVDGRDLVQPTLKNFFHDLKMPAFRGLQVGHADIQRPFFLNTNNVLTCGSKPRMINYAP